MSGRSCLTRWIARGEAGEAGAGEQVIVFHEHHVVQPEAVILAAARDDGGFLERAQTGRRLACVENLRLRFARAFDELPRQRRDAAESLQEIQRDAFGGQDRARRAAHLEDRFASHQRRSIRLQDRRPAVADRRAGTLPPRFPRPRRPHVRAPRSARAPAAFGDTKNSVVTSPGPMSSASAAAMGSWSLIVQVSGSGRR